LLNLSPCHEYTWGVEVKGSVGIGVIFVLFSGKFSLAKRETDPEIGDRKPSNVLIVGEEKYAVVGYV
jgi:hypothetical protein